MKVYIFILILAAFLQSSFVPINLVLLLVIARSLIVKDTSNLIISFGLGIFLGILQAQNIGFWALVLVLAAKLSQLVQKLPISRNLFTVLVVSALLILAVNFLQSVVLTEGLNPVKLIVEVLLSVPVYLIILFSEERFIVSPEIKLKVKD